MIVSWNWLKEYVPLDMPLDVLVERLMMAGFNLEGTSDVDGDIAIDLEITSNRPDCLGHLGIAREIAVLFGKEMKVPPTHVLEDSQPIDSQTSVSIEESAAAWCPQFRARVIHNVKIGPSPEWMQRRLRTVGVNPINNVVDITNYVMLECGQPLHAYDYDKLTENRIVVRNSLAGEKLLAINNKEYALNPGMAVIADAKKVVGLAGVMGGAATEVSNSTKTILLEAAEFDPLTVRRGSRAIDLSSDASYRFERKIDSLGTAWANERAVHLICNLTGGTAAKGVIQAGSPPKTGAPVRLRYSRIEKILGMEVAPNRAREVFTRLGLDVLSEDAESLTAVPPSFRRDLTREIDLIEEVGRVIGYDSVSENRILPLMVAERSKTERVTAIIRDGLSASGFCEAVTFTFVGKKEIGTLRPWSSSDPLAVDHSKRRQEPALRQSLAPSLAAAIRLNETKGNEVVALFETAHVFLPHGGGELPDEPMMLGIASTQDFRVVRGQVEALLERLKISSKASPTTIYGLDPERTAEYRIGDKRIGYIGQMAPAVRASFELHSDPVVAEFELASLVEAAELIPKANAVPDKPAMIRDLAIVLEEQIRWANMEEVILQNAGPCLESLEFLDLYRGKQVPPAHKSIACRLTYRAPDRTLTREEVDGFQQSVIHALDQKLNGKLRM